ncbi:MAG: LysM peptidoglycan-binding domain-containing protein [Candidatus Moraniibacteriota bacterium]|nr:MAG: LysM peptidoglycan-binding domain-containing protein [Candidatus Moranbacteria bacterium]
MKVFQICVVLVCAFLANTLQAAEQQCVTVERGDTLEKIVINDFHLERSDVDAIATENDIANRDLIYAGDKVCNRTVSSAVAVSQPKPVKAQEEEKVSRVSVNLPVKPASNPGKAEKLYAHVIHSLGHAPFATEKRPATLSENIAALNALGYSKVDAEEILRKKASGEVEIVEVPCGSIIPEMIFRGGKKISGGILMDFCHGKKPAQSEFAIKACANSGRCVYQFSTCRNYFPSFTAPDIKEVKVLPQEVSKAVPPRIRAEGETSPALLEYEANAGGFWWRNGLAKGNALWGEALLWTPDAGKGISFGAGGYASSGDGNSKVAAYSWHERSYGAQVGVKGNYLGSPDEEGRRYPRNWQVKARLLKDQVEGSNPESGYAMEQNGPKQCVYGEYIAQKDAWWTYGITGEGCVANHQSINSTWEGDKPQDRGSVQLNVFAERRITNQTAVRGILGVAHQNWDDLTLGRGTLELRYRDKKNGLLVAAGPSVAVPIGKLPKEYAGVARSKLVTPAALIRVELGGVIRKKDAEKRAESVHLAGSHVSAATHQQAPRSASKSKPKSSWNSYGFNNK